MNISEIMASPELWFRAIDIDTGRIDYFDLFEIVNGKLIKADAPGGMVKLVNCHVDLWTGYKNNDSQDIYGKDITTMEEEIFVILWNPWIGQWIAVNINNDQDNWPVCDFVKMGSTLVGNIHQLDKLPSEVKKWLK